MSTAPTFRTPRPDERVVAFLAREDVARLVTAGLGEAVHAATPFGVVPGLAVSEEVYQAYRRWRGPGLRAVDTRGLADYLIRRFRLLRAVK